MSEVATDIVSGEQAEGAAIGVVGEQTAEGWLIRKELWVGGAGGDVVDTVVGAVGETMRRLDGGRRMQKNAAEKKGESRGGMGMLKCLVVGAVWPRWAVRVSEGMKAWELWLVHVLGVVIAGGMMLLFGVWQEQVTHRGRYVFDLWGELFGAFTEGVGELFWAMSGGFWWQAALGLVFGVVLIEVGIVFAGLLLMGWGARPGERLRETMLRGVRRMWAMSGLFIGVVSVMGLMWLIGFPFYWFEWVDDTFRNGVMETLAMSVMIGMVWLVALAGILWVMVGTLRGVSVGGKGWDAELGEGMREAWPLRCEGNEGVCGYQLVEVEEGVSCPECGMDVMASVRVKRGRYGKWGRESLWEKVGGWWGWSARQSLVQPRRFARGIEVHLPRTGGGWMMAGSVVRMMVLAVIGAWAFILFETVMRGQWYAFRDFEDVLAFVFAPMMIVSVMGLWILGWLLGVLGFYELVLGVVIRMFGGRNRVYELHQIVCGQCLLAFIGVCAVTGLMMFGYEILRMMGGQGLGYRQLETYAFMAMWAFALLQFVMLIVGVMGCPRKVEG
ncbi:hypothetical protein [Poriferisphaera corsica]|nr:hypothetical protein [Poriferisphaera corsica]